MDNVFNPFDADASIERRQRNLPHWSQIGATYFVTFRTADALPQARLRSLWVEREAWLRSHPQPWSQAEKSEYRDRFMGQVQRWLDAGHGECVLRRPEIARVVADALHHFDGVRYVLDEFAVMPNHVHVIVKPAERFELQSILQSWKGFTARTINKELLRKGPLWQRESFDHLVRSWEHVEYFRQYIQDNPAKAGLPAAQAIVSKGKIGIVPT